MYIFGSWAARYHGEEGPDPGDIDVLLVGAPDRDEAFNAALRAETRIGRQVNTTIRSRDAWRSGTDGFVKQVQSSPLVPIKRGSPLQDSSE